MGGHGGLNILPQKRWNVYRRDNRLRVRRDEEQHQESQEHQRQQDERKRMSDVLILLKRKKAEAQARLRKHCSSSTPGYTNTQSKSFASSAPSSSNGVADASYVAWLSSLVNFSKICKISRAVGERTCRDTPGRAEDRCCYHPVVSHYSKEFVSAEPCTTKLSSGDPELNAVLPEAGTSCWLPSGHTHGTPSYGYSNSATTELTTTTTTSSSEFVEPFVEEQPGVVRVRLPTSGYSTASTTGAFESSCAVSLLSTRAAVCSGDAHLSSSVCFETEAKFNETQPDTYSGAAEKQTRFSEIRDDSLPQQQQRLRGEMRHVNFFEAEEKEMHTLEMKRKKYLREAGYPPDATSEFDREIRNSLRQAPWYYKPPSTYSASTFSVGFSLHSPQSSSGSFSRQPQQQMLQQSGFNSSRVALVKQSLVAGPVNVGAVQGQPPAQHHQAHEAAGTENHVKGSLPGESRMLAAVKEPTVDIPVNSKAHHRGREARGGVVKDDKPPLRENEKRRRNGEAKRKQRNSRDLRQEGREKTKKRRKKDGHTKGVIKEDPEDDVECLQVLLLVQDEEEGSTTDLTSAAPSAIPMQEMLEKTEQVGRQQKEPSEQGRKKDVKSLDEKQKA